MHAINHKTVSPLLLALQIWLFSSVALAAGWMTYNLIFDGRVEWDLIIIVLICALIGSVPVFIALNIALQRIAVSTRVPVGKIKRFTMVCMMSAMLYAFPGSLIMYNHGIVGFSICFFKQSAALCGSVLVALLITYRQLRLYFTDEPSFDFSTIENSI